MLFGDYFFGYCVGKKFGCVLTPRATLEVFLLLLKCALFMGILCSHHFPLHADHMFRTNREPGHLAVGPHGLGSCLLMNVY